MFSHSLRKNFGKRNFKFRCAPKVSHYSRPKVSGTYIYYPSGGNLELFVYRRVIRSFRRRSRRRRYKLLFRFLPNYTITSKGQNSRMGKGKGKIVRASIQFRTNKLFMIVRGLSYYRILFFFKRFYKTTGIRFLAFRVKKAN